jgi:hypothetical protein
MMMKKLTIVFGLLTVVCLLVLAVQAFASNAHGGESLTRYEREHIRAIENQTRAIENLTREVKRIADSMR